MNCSSRISRILPEAPPLSWDRIPVSPTSRKSSTSMGGIGFSTKGRLRRKQQKCVKKLSEPRSTTGFINISFSFTPSLWSDRPNLCKASSPRPVGNRLGEEKPLPALPSNNQTEGSSIGWHQSQPARSTSAPAFESIISPPWSPPEYSAEPEPSAWSGMAGRVHQRQSHRREQSLSNVNNFSHIMSSSEFMLSPVSPLSAGSHRQRPTRNDDIDWASFFENKPLPSSAGWSRSASNIVTLDAKWNPGRRTTSP